MPFACTVHVLAPTRPAASSHATMARAHTVVALLLIAALAYAATAEGSVAVARTDAVTTQPRKLLVKVAGSVEYYDGDSEPVETITIGDQEDKEEDKKDDKDKDTEGETAAVEAAVRQALTGNPGAGAGSGVSVRVEGSGN